MIILSHLKSEKAAKGEGAPFIRYVRHTIDVLDLEFSFTKRPFFRFCRRFVVARMQAEDADLTRTGLLTPLRSVTLSVSGPLRPVSHSVRTRALATPPAYPVRPPRTAPQTSSSQALLLRKQSLKSVGTAAHSAAPPAPSDLIDWILNGPAISPRTAGQEAKESRSKQPGYRPLFSASLQSSSPSRFVFSSASLPSLPTRSDSFAPALARTAPAPSPERRTAQPPRRHHTLRRQTSYKSPMPASRRLINELSASNLDRAARDAAATAAVGLGLDDSSKWRYAGGMVSSQAELAQTARRALARNRYIREALNRTLELERVPTPQHAARRELPPPSRKLEGADPFEVDEREILSLRYWAPPSAVKKMPHYLFHEPGPRVRQSLLVLEEMRGRGGHGRLEARHRQEVLDAREYTHDAVLQQDMDRADKRAAATLQKSWRGHSAHQSRTEAAATIVQKSYRGHNARADLERQKRERAVARRKRAGAGAADRPGVKFW